MEDADFPFFRKLGTVLEISERQRLAVAVHPTSQDKSAALCSSRLPRCG